MTRRPRLLRTALVLGLCMATVAYSSGSSAWWSAVAGLLVAGVVWALGALL